MRQEWLEIPLECLNGKRIWLPIWHIEALVESETVNGATWVRTTSGEEWHVKENIGAILTHLDTLA